MKRNLLAAVIGQLLLDHQLKNVEKDDKAMTAYLMTEAQHAQIVDALESISLRFVCEAAHHAKKDRHGVGEDCPIETRYSAALAMLKAMKPSTPVAHLVYDPGACSQDLYFEEELGDMDGNSIESR